MHYGISTALLVPYLVWVFGRPQVVLRFRMTALLRDLSAELHPFVPGIAVCMFLADSWGRPWVARAMDAAVAAVQLIGWLISPDDDDRWKRRRRRLMARVRSAGRRLAAEYRAAR